MAAKNTKAKIKKEIIIANSRYFFARVTLILKIYYMQLVNGSDILVTC